MKKTLISCTLPLLFFILIANVTAQETADSGCNTERATLKYKDDFVLKQRLYHWKMFTDSIGSYIFQIESESAKCFFLNKLSEETFKIGFKKKILEFDSTLTDVEIVEKSLQLFFQLKLELMADKDLRPKAGYISVRNNIPVFRFSTVAYESAIRYNEESRNTSKNEIEKLKKMSISVANTNKDSIKILSYIVDRKVNDWDNGPESEEIFYKIQDLDTKTRDKIMDSVYKAFTEEVVNIGLAKSIQKEIDINMKNIKIMKERGKQLKKDKRNKIPIHVSTEKFLVDSISVEFFDGNIKNIFAYGTLLTNDNLFNLDSDLLPITFEQGRDMKIPIIFNNYIPVPFSSFKDYEKDLLLWQFAIDGSKTRRKTAKSDYYINFKDLIGYIPQLTINQEDYSPKDEVVILKPSDQSKPLYKEETSKILKAKVYSDFLGLNSDNPNGLIQFEVSKKFILNNSRGLRKHKIHRPLQWTGVLNYLEPIFTYSKVEDNNKYIIPSVTSRPCNDCPDGEMVKPEVSLLQMSRFQNFGAKGILNIVVFDVPSLKSSFYFNIGGGLGISSVSDTARIWKGGKITSTTNIERFNINTLQVTPEFVYQVKTDGRLGLTATLRSNWMFVQNDRIVPIYNPLNKFNDQKTNENFLITAQLDGFVKTGNNSKSGEIFARLAYTRFMFYGKQNFIQLQLGYLFNILKKE